MKTIYIGGGTPSAIDLEPLFIALKPYVDKNTEFSVEGNVLDFSKERLKQYKKYGVNRISLGIQAMNDKILMVLGRRHKRIDVIKQIKLIKRYIKNINVDLIYGFNELSLPTLKKELKDYLMLDVNHISTYALEIKSGTKFYLMNKKTMDSSLVREQFDLIYKTLVKNGYNRYEISNFAKLGYESKHNLTYWRDLSYYGLGLGAASYVNGYRYQNTFSLTKYLNGVTYENKEKITPNEDKKYYLMLKLRLKEGINLDEYQEKFKIDLLNEKGGMINSLINRGLLKMKGRTLVVTYEGSLLLDIILRELF